jgi:hypothetical protein
MATMFLENLKASFSDFLRPNYYGVTFSGNIFGEFEFGFLTKGATFPFMTYNTTTVFYNNLPRHFVNAVDYDPIPFTFLVDDGLKVLRFFDNWRKLVMNDGSRTFNYKEEYSGNIEIELLNRKQFMRARVIIKDAYPVNIDNIALAADTNDTIMELGVSFRYDDVSYEFDDGLSIAGIRDTVFDLAQGTVGKGIDFLKDGIEGLANRIPSNVVSNMFGGFGQGGGKFPASEEGIAEKSKEIFAGFGGGGASSNNMVANAKDAAGNIFNSSTGDSVGNLNKNAKAIATGALNNATGKVKGKLTAQVSNKVSSFGGSKLGGNISRTSKFARDPGGTARSFASQTARKGKAAATKKAKSFVFSKAKDIFGGLFG